MVNLQYVSLLPKLRRQTYRVEVDGRTLDSEEELLDWTRSMMKGDIYYTRTNFRDPKTGNFRYNNRQRNFTDGYWVYTFWFTRKSDAAIFRLAWDNV